MSDDDHVLDPATVRLMDAANAGCEESRLLFSRRAMLGIGVGLFSAAVMPKTALAGSPTDPRFLLVLLRGGMDGMDTVVPVGDPDYAMKREGLAADKAKLLPLMNNSMFMLNPALPTFRDLYDAGEARFIPSTCIPLRTRSHFDCQDNLENGLPGLSTSTTGWLNRALSALSSSSAVRVGGALGVSEAPVVLRGPVPTLGWSLNWLEGVDPVTLNAVMKMYAARDKAMATALGLGLKAHKIATAAGGQNKAEAEDPNMTRLRKSFRGAARLLKDNAGPRIAVISVDNFDTHGFQGALKDGANDGLPGQLYGRLKELDTGVKDFKELIGDAWKNTVVLAVSEFGRKVSPNGSLGTDHGTGGVALMAGGAVMGGIDQGSWPGLTKLYENVDLIPTVDTRSIFKSVLHHRFGIGKTALDTTVFPGSATAAPIISGYVKTGLVAETDIPAGIFGYSRKYDIAQYRAKAAVGAAQA